MTYDMIMTNDKERIKRIDALLLVTIGSAVNGALVQI